MPNDLEKKKKPKTAGVPPVWIVDFVLKIRRFLIRLADRIVPSRLPVIDLFMGAAKTALIREVARLRIADLLVDGPLSAAAIAERTGTRADALERGLRVLVAVNVFRRLPDGRFANNHVSKSLITGSHENIRGFAEWFGCDALVRAWADLPTALREDGVSFERVNGRPLWDWLATDDEAHDAFVEGMGAISESDAPAIAAAYPFGHFKTVCDVGGGVGAVLAAVLTKHTHVRGVLYDDEVMLRKAKTYLDQWGVSDRVEFVPGNFMERVPHRADAYMIRLVLHNWDDARALDILRTCRAAMDPGQPLISVEFVYEADTVGTLVPYMDIEALAFFGARERTPEDIARLFEQAGFRYSRLIRLPAGQGVYEAFAV